MIKRILAASFIALISSTPALAQQQQIQKIVVHKSERRMELLDNDMRTVRIYRIALGGNPKGHKEREGDQRTPEGVYRIEGRNYQSRYHRSLKISYPNEQDKKRAKNMGVSPGGDIMIHGVHNNSGFFDALKRLSSTWTNGCIAVSDPEIEEILSLVADGTEIEIFP